MGSTLPHVHSWWVIAAIICALFFLVFDAGRHFVQQLGPVRLRSFSGEGQGGRFRWMHYDLPNFYLVSGALLQGALILGLGATVMAMRDFAIASATLSAIAAWAAMLVIWKFVLAIVPDDIAETILRAIMPVSNVFYWAFWPLLFPLRSLVARLDRDNLGEGEDEEVTDEDVQAYIDVGEEEGILEATEGKLLQQIVDFGDRVAHELMTPRIDVLAFDANGSVSDLARVFSESKYSRIPIYRNSIDSIIGIVHIKDIFDAILKNQTPPVADLARPPYFVSATKKVSELLREFQSEHLQVAVVVDEYGGTAGIISIEDIIEEIVGEIADEHEDEEVAIVDVGDGSYLVSGLLRVEMLQETLDADLEGEDYETVAGLIFTTLGRVPKVGAVVTKNGFRFEVDRADRRRIYRVKVSRDPDWRGAEGEER